MSHGHNTQNDMPSGFPNWAITIAGSLAVAVFFLFAGISWRGPAGKECNAACATECKSGHAMHGKEGACCEGHGEKMAGTCHHKCDEKCMKDGKCTHQCNDACKKEGASCEGHDAKMAGCTHKCDEHCMKDGKCTHQCGDACKKEAAAEAPASGEKKAETGH